MLEIGSAIGFGQLGIFAAIAYLFVHRYGKHLSDCDKLAATWFGFNAACHLIFEGAYVFFTFFGTVEKSNHILALPWKEYAKSDKRWAVFDVATLSIEVWTVFFCGLVSASLVWAIWTKSKWRHPLQVVLCVCELYGGWMTFAPEWFSRPFCPNLVTHTLTYLWLYLVIPNGVWVVIPLWLLKDSLDHYFALLGKKQRKAEKSVRAKPVKAVEQEPIIIDESPVVEDAPKARKPAPRSPTGRKKKSE